MAILVVGIGVFAVGYRCATAGNAVDGGRHHGSRRGGHALPGHGRAPP
ncbi:hypothetical protein ABZ357_27220 [Streptomyces sp. NPDC005917]